MPGEPMYRITVALDEPKMRGLRRQQPLVAGMQLQADVLLERRRLIEWLFEPLLGLAGGCDDDLRRRALAWGWFGARRVPVILQTEAAECGLACLAMVAAAHGHTHRPAHAAPALLAVAQGR